MPYVGLFSCIVAADGSEVAAMAWEKEEKREIGMEECGGKRWESEERGRKEGLDVLAPTQNQVLIPTDQLTNRETSHHPILSQWR